MNQKDSLLLANEALREAAESVRKALEWQTSEDDRDKAIVDAISLLYTAKSERTRARWLAFKESDAD